MALYKQLCSIIGTEAVKRREVRLQVTDDRPQLPVKILEKLINDRIDEDGNPHFPDFMDVVHCVFKANRDDRLGWSDGEVMSQGMFIVLCLNLPVLESRLMVAEDRPFAEVSYDFLIEDTHGGFKWAVNLVISSKKTNVQQPCNILIKNTKSILTGPVAQ